LSATIIPIASEIYFVYCLKHGQDTLLVITIATIGNTLGSIVTYFIGGFGKLNWLVRFGFTEQKLQRFTFQFKKYGVVLALLSWIPFVGDVFVLFLGYFHTPKWLTFSFFLIGKMIRYAFIAYLFYK
jgi:membrane protein YqaA with SNARE-associated domain